MHGKIARGDGPWARRRRIIASEAPTAQIPATATSLEPLARDPRRHQLGMIDVVPNILITTLALANVIARPAVFNLKNDLSNPKFQVEVQQPPPNLLITTLQVQPVGKSDRSVGVQRQLQVSDTNVPNLAIRGQVQNPFTPGDFPLLQRNLFLPADTSRGTPKNFLQDQFLTGAFQETAGLKWSPRILSETSASTPNTLLQKPFAPVDTSGVQWRGWLPTDTNYQNRAVLAVTAAPFVPNFFLSPVRIPWLPSDTSIGTPKTLYQDDSFAPSQSEFHTIPRKERGFADTSFRNVAILSGQVTSPFTPVDFANIQRALRVLPEGSTGSYPLYNPQAPATTKLLDPLVKPVWNVADTSKGTPLTLLTAQVSAPFRQNDFPSAIEYRLQFFSKNDPQEYPEFIPPAVTPPVVTPQTPAGRKRHDRYIARFKGEDYVFQTLEALEEFVQWATQAEKPKPKKIRKPVKIRLAPEYSEYVAQKLDAPKISVLPASKALVQVRRLEIALKDIEDDDEEVAWLMLIV